jgi:dsDNA-specific endonuclease/ATPase MutS2
MALKAMVEKIEDVQEEHQDLYEETDGKFVLDVEEVDGYALEDVAGMKKVLEEAKAGRSEKGEQVSKLEKKIKTLEQQNEELEATQDEKAKEQVEELKGQYQTRIEELEKEKETKINELSEQLHKTKVEDTLLRELSKAGPKGPTKNGADVLPRILRDQVKLNDDGDVVVVNENGNVRVGKGGKDMTVSELMGETVEKYPEFFQPEGATGSGSQGNTNTGGKTKISRSEWNDMTPEERYKATTNEDGTPKKDFEINEDS